MALLTLCPESQELLSRVLLDALENNPHLKLHAIFTDTEDTPWIDEFAKVLRNFISIHDQKKAMRLSMR